MDSPDVLTNLNALREHAKNKGNEWGLRIDFVDGEYKSYALHEGGPGSVSMYVYYDTAYDAHSHPEDTDGYHNLTGFSMGDVYGTLSTGGDPKYANYKGSIVIAYDGSEYLLAVNDRAKLQSFWKDDANKKLFESGSDSYFKDKNMDKEYRDIREQLEGEGYSPDDANDYAMSYLLDKYDTGLKISKKEKGKSSFKEMKTEENTTTNEYKPTICP